jgi:hypothetical protein
MDEPLPVRAPRPAPRSDVQRPVQVPVTEGEGVTPADPEATVAPPAPFTPLLRTPQTADESESDRRIRDVLFRASQALTRVNAATLNREARTQHETARRFVEQANQALIERNYVFASYLADKAETLAKGISR